MSQDDAMPICEATAERCTCFKPAVHVDAGDPVHECPDEECRGQWTGSFNGDDFVVVRFPGMPEGTTLEEAAIAVLIQHLGDI